MNRLGRLRSGVSWGAASTVAVLACQLLLMGVLARLLTPADFGLVALANVVLRFLANFSQMGIGTALVQRAKVTEGDIAAALSVAMAVALLCVLACLAAAPAAQSFFAVPQVGAVLSVLSCAFLFNAFASVPTALLRRESKFRALAIVEVASYLIGYALVGLSMAALGLGAWSLVAAMLSQSAATAIGTYLARPYALRFRHSVEDRAKVLGFGTRYSLIGFVEFLTGNLDAVVIGKLLGAAPAGLYNRAALIVHLPLLSPVSIFTRTLFPILSVSHDGRDRSHAVQLSVLVVGSYTFAVAAAIALSAPDIVAVLLGSGWEPVVPVIRILCIGAAVCYVSQVGGVALDSLGRLTVKLRLQGCMLALLAVLLWQLAPLGLHGVAAAVVCTEFIRFCVYFVVLARLFAWPARDCLLLLVSMAAPALVAGAAVGLAIQALASASSWLRLPLEVAATIVGVASALWALRGIHARIPGVRILAERRSGLRTWLGLA